MIPTSENICPFVPTRSTLTTTQNIRQDLKPNQSFELLTDRNTILISHCAMVNSGPVNWKERQGPFEEHKNILFSLSLSLAFRDS